MGQRYRLRLFSRGKALQIVCIFMYSKYFKVLKFDQVVSTDKSKTLLYAMSTVQCCICVTHVSIRL